MSSPPKRQRSPHPLGQRRDASLRRRLHSQSPSPAEVADGLRSICNELERLCGREGLWAQQVACLLLGAKWRCDACPPLLHCDPVQNLRREITATFGSWRPTMQSLTATKCLFAAACALSPDLASPPKSSYLPLVMWT